jgi:putative sterol carrier protein
MSSDPVLADFVGPLPNLLGNLRTADERSFARVGQRLSGVGKAANIRVSLTEADSVTSWSLELSPKGCTVARGGKRKADLEIILASPDVWLRIASGRLSPLEAFVQGQMRVRGDIALARRIARAVKDLPS